VNLRRISPIIALGLALALPASALAADAPPAAPVATTAATTTTTTPTTTTPAPKPKPKPKPKPIPGGSISANPYGVNGRHKAQIAGSTFVVRGTLSKFVKGQRVVVRITKGKHKVASQKTAVHKSGKRGTYHVTFRASGSGRWKIVTVHTATKKQRALKSRPFHVTILRRYASFGSSGLTVRILQNLLRLRHFVPGQKGVYDARTGRAVQAARKMNRMPRTFTASEGVFVALQHGAGKFKVRYPHQGHHVEADLTHQVLGLINGNRVSRLYTMSSGKPSTPTILGSFRVYMRDPGTNAEGMVYSNYFIRGYAIHGYAEVPPYAASHGCLRVPVPDAIPIWNWIGGTGPSVDVYYR
jgi:L,D-transpeptidase catalytic domain